MYPLLLSAFAALVTTSSSSYAPEVVQCPPNVRLVRPPHGLAKQELDWVRGRKDVAADAFSSYLERLELENFDIQHYTSKLLAHPGDNMPTIGFALSGGGWRSAYTGIGAVRALDRASTSSLEAKTGGLLQSMTYFAGLSGGAWPTSSYTLHNYPKIDDLISAWKVNISRLAAQNDSAYAATVETYFAQIAPKFEAGFNVSVTDFFGRVFSYEFFPGSEGALNTTWSSIAELSGFQNFSGPMPILQASSIQPGDPSAFGVFEPRANNTLYEWTPFEFGSFKAGFTPTKYVGSLLDANGSVSTCVQGLDQAGFVMASVASAYNYWWLGAMSNGSLGQFSKRESVVYAHNRGSLSRRGNTFGIDTLNNLNSAFNETFGLSLAQIANPSIPAAFSPHTNITLADGSEALQAIPFWALIQPERNLDFIIAWEDDSNSAPYSWNNGTNMYDTYMLAKEARLPFPIAPPASTFLARNYTLRPTFFGCNASLTTTGDSRSPIVLYMTNAPYSWYSNYSWTKPAMSYEEFDGVMVNSFNIVTQGNGTLDAEWPECIACAAIERSLERMGMERSRQCDRCFEKYCWDGTVDEPDAVVGMGDGKVFDPALLLDPEYKFDDWVRTHPFSG